MDWNRLFNMLSRMFLRKAVNKGISYAARRGKDEGAMTPEERKQAKSAKDMAQRAQKAARLGRRMMK
jgi:hypothetical protein